MAKSEQRMTIALVCTVCKSRNYLTQRNKINTVDKLALKKFCNNCKKRTDHKENDKLK
ncbi:MAG: 50S ribosomal protein L33 [Candidatus Levybacteria bacterium]|nr:50S ribosomal protein L33 [Candidatus Levybacteria bacterium]